MQKQVLTQCVDMVAKNAHMVVSGRGQITHS